ncbi:MAG TPA: TetR/AcrR family transcriptional regulator [Streptosporangiaceae bacterium]
MTASTTRRPGGRTARNTAAVFTATVDELADRGFDEISIESIAARAGVHKTTVYRRWGSKAELVRQALAATAQSMIEAPDTGTVSEDLRLLSRAVQATLGSPRGAATTRSVLAGAAASPEIRAMMAKFWDTRLAAIAAIIDRGVARGELPAGTEPAGVMHAVAAPLYYRLLVTGEPLTPEHADETAAAALAAARAGVFSRT